MNVGRRYLRIMGGAPLLVVLTLGCGRTPTNTGTGKNASRPSSVLQLTAAVAAPANAGTSTDSKSKTLKPEMTVSAKELIQEFEDDEKAAGKKFGHKVVRITGTLWKIETDTPGVTVAVLEGDGKFHVRCEMSGSDADRLKQHKTGDKVAFQTAGGVAIVNGKIYAKQCVWVE